VRFRTVTAALIGCAAAFGAASDDIDGANRPPWRVYKVTTTWSITATLVTEGDGFRCRTPASLTASGGAFYVGTPAAKKSRFGVRIAKNVSAFAYGKHPKWPFAVPAKMTLTVRETTCDNGGQAGSCTGTYHSVGGVIGYPLWLVGPNRSVPARLNWSHDVEDLDHRPPMSCGPEIGEPVYELLSAGFYAPRGGGAYKRGVDVPLRQARLLGGTRFTTSESRTSGDGVFDSKTVEHQKATLVRVR
jgi:hypothetical protein